MGELLRETIEKTETNLKNSEFRIQFALDEMTGVEEETFPEFSIHVMPTYQSTENFGIPKNGFRNIKGVLKN